MRIWTKLQVMVHDLGSNQRGASLVEYALLMMLIALVALVAIRFFGQELSTSYTDFANSFP